MEPTVVDTATSLKETQLAEWLRERQSVLIGYSGGVDSTYLAVLAREVLGRDRVIAVLGRSASVPAAQSESARSIAIEQDIALRVVETAELSDARYAANPVNRCYFCKSTLWQTLVPLARELGIETILDGTNADDVSEYRPGALAGSEHGVQSPLALIGLTKAEIRVLSRARGLATWSQPSAPCLASRIPYGTEVTSDRLAQVESAEQALRDLGIEGNLRVRHHGDMARIELESALLDEWLDEANARRLVAAVRAAGFRRVAIDLRGFRSGSLNVLEGVVAA
ncbi:MAG TPA: ATP-dependent sacrificial sulfur transferase LarE [Gemmatimonadaceae bacterium]